MKCESRKKEAIKQAKNHQYEPKVYGIPNGNGGYRPRLAPDVRFGLLMNAFIDACIGKVKHKDEDSMWHIKHTELNEIYVDHNQKMSVASVFNYFNDRENMIDCIVAWASNKKNIESSDSVISEAAATIMTQYAAVRPKAAAKKGYSIELKKLTK